MNQVSLTIIQNGFRMRFLTKTKYRTNAIDINTIITTNRTIYHHSVQQFISTSLLLKSAMNLYTKLTKKQFLARYLKLPINLYFHIRFFFLKFNLTCEENEWKLTLIGTLKMSAELIMLPMSGLLSDRFELSN